MIKAFLSLLLLFLLVTMDAFGASGIKTQTTANASGTSTLLLAENRSRNYILIQNRGATNVYIKFNSAHSGTEGIEIVAGGNWEPPEAPKNAIYMKSASGTPSITTIEGVQ